MLLQQLKPFAPSRTDVEKGCLALTKFCAIVDVHSKLLANALPRSSKARLESLVERGRVERLDSWRRQRLPGPRFQACLRPQQSKQAGHFGAVLRAQASHLRKARADVDERMIHQHRQL